MNHRTRLAAVAFTLLTIVLGSRVALAQVLAPPSEAPAPAVEQPAPGLAPPDQPPPVAAPDSGPQKTSTPPVPKAPPKLTSDLEHRIATASDSTAKLLADIERLERVKKLTAAQARGLRWQIDSWRKTLRSLGKKAQRLEDTKEAWEGKAFSGEQLDLLRDNESMLEDELVVAEQGLKGVSEQVAEAESASGWKLIGTILRARCTTAFCFDNGDQKDWLGIEPLVELPVGKSLSLSNSSLGSYVNNHDLRIDLAAGARVWLFRDLVSLSIYLSKPLTDGGIRLEGSPFTYPASSMRRTLPGIGVGLLFDSLWFGFDRDELRNGDSQDPNAFNPGFPPNTVISSTWTLTVSLQPVTALRTAIGSAVQSTKGGNR